MTSTATRRALGLAEKTILGFIAGGAAAIAVVEIVFLVQRIVDLAVGAMTTLSIPLPEPAPVDIGTSPALVSAASSTVSVVIEGAPDSVRGTLIAAAIVSSLLVLGICLTVIWLCVRVFVGKPFVRSATWGIGIVSVLIIVAGLGVPALRGVANAEAVAHLGLDTLPIFLVEVDPAPIGWALALAVVAASFEIGQRLQRDTDRLI